MLVRGVVHHEIDDHAQPAIAGGPHELHEVAEGAVIGVDIVEVADVVAVVAVRRGVERHQPETGDAEPGEVIDPAGEPGEVADAVAIAVEECFDIEAIDDRVFPPEIAGRLDLHPFPPLRRRP